MLKYFNNPEQSHHFKSYEPLNSKVAALPLWLIKMTVSQISRPVQYDDSISCVISLLAAMAKHSMSK